MLIKNHLDKGFTVPFCDFQINSVLGDNVTSGIFMTAQKILSRFFLSRPISAQIKAP